MFESFIWNSLTPFKIADAYLNIQKQSQNVNKSNLGSLHMQILYEKIQQHACQHFSLLYAFAKEPYGS